MVSVSQIISAPYLLQVCLCAEHKLMTVVFDSSDSTDDIRNWMKKKSIRISHVPLLENDI